MASCSLINALNACDRYSLKANGWNVQNWDPEGKSVAELDQLIRQQFMNMNAARGGEKWPAGTKTRTTDKKFKIIDAPENGVPTVYVYLSKNVKQVHTDDTVSCTRTGGSQKKIIFARKFQWRKGPENLFFKAFRNFRRLRITVEPAVLATDKSEEEALFIQKEADFIDFAREKNIRGVVQKLNQFTTLSRKQHREKKYLVLEPFQQDLWDSLAKRELSAEQRWDIATQLVTILAEFEANGIIHGDLKLENILLNIASDGRVRISLTDFSFSSFDNTHLEGISGSLGYLAPECFIAMLKPSRTMTKKAKGKIDVWALQMVWLCLLTDIHACAMKILDPFPPTLAADLRTFQYCQRAIQWNREGKSQEILDFCGKDEASSIFTQLFAQMNAAIPQQRPSASEIKTIWEKMADQKSRYCDLKNRQLQNQQLLITLETDDRKAIIEEESEARSEAKAKLDEKALQQFI